MEKKLTGNEPALKEEKHYFKPSEEDKDFCEVCGKNFRNTDVHHSRKYIPEETTAINTNPVKETP